MNGDTTQAVGNDDRELEPHPEGQALETASLANTPEPGVHETLLESVSVEAIVAGGTGGDGSEGRSEQAEPEGDATDGVPLAEDLTIVPDAAAEPLQVAIECVEAARAAGESMAQAVAETTGAILSGAAVPSTMPAAGLAVPDLRTLLEVARSPRIAEAMGELGEVNATVLTYLRGEGTAAMAHWQALSGAKTPADAIRIQVDEMQRAADASLNCFAAIAKRANRFTTAMAGRHPARA